MFISTDSWGKISDSLAAKSSTVFTRKTVIVSDAENLVYSGDLEHFSEDELKFTMNLQ